LTSSEHTETAPAAMLLLAPLHPAFLQLIFAFELLLLILP